MSEIDRPTDPRGLPTWLRLAVLLVFAAALVACADPAVETSEPAAHEEPGTDSTPILAKGRALLQQQDYTGAAELLEPLTQTEPENAQAWMLLGLAYHRAGDLEKALPAHRKASELEETAPTGLYNVAAAYALQGEPETALDWLGRLRATGRADLTRVAFDPDFQTIHDDPRLAALYPSAQQLADPFVEPVRILHEWVAEAAGDAFGWIARDIGDVDGDGVHDLTTSAPNHDARAGKVYTYSGRSGALLWQRNGEAGSQLGQGIEAAGDTNGDGVPDVIAGAPGVDKAFVFSGKDGAVLLKLAGGQAKETFGAAVSDVGDFDGDGHEDVLVGAPANDAKGEDAGRAGVYSGKDGTILRELWGEKAGDAFGSTGAGARIGDRTFVVVGAPNAGEGNRGRTYVYSDGDSEPAFVIDAEETGARLGGMFVSVVGDVDGDGVADVYASDWADGGLGPSTGKIYVHSGATGERLRVLAGEAPGDGFGIGPASAGDVDGDGHWDLIVGAWQHGGGAPSGGKVYLFSGKDGALLRTITAKVPGETFGFDATGMGDVDGDGQIDFLLTSAWSPVKGPRSGRMFIIAGEKPGS